MNSYMENCDICGEECHALDLHYVGGGLNIYVCERCIKTPKQQWISVKDKLPDDSVDLLVFVNSEYKHIAIGWFEQDTKMFVAWLETLEHYPVNQINFWMPLPEQPKD